MDLFVMIGDSIADLGWDSDWINDNEVVAVAESKWCDYHIHFIWQKTIKALYVIFYPDLVLDNPEDLEVLKFIIAANQRLWLGHFDLLETGAIHYRHVIHVYSDANEIQNTIKEVCSIMLSEFDLFYPGFRSLQSNLPLSKVDIELLSLQSQGEA